MQTSAASQHEAEFSESRTPGTHQVASQPSHHQVLHQCRTSLAGSSFERSLHWSSALLLCVLRCALDAEEGKARRRVNVKPTHEAACGYACNAIPCLQTDQPSAVSALRRLQLPSKAREGAGPLKVRADSSPLQARVPAWDARRLCSRRPPRVRCAVCRYCASRALATALPGQLVEHELQYVYKHEPDKAFCSVSCQQCSGAHVQDTSRLLPGPVQTQTGWGSARAMHSCIALRAHNLPTDFSCVPCLITSRLQPSHLSPSCLTKLIHTH